MVATTEIKTDISQLQEMIRKLGSGYAARVGLIGGKAGQKHKAKPGEAPLTNVEIGVVQELGSETRHIPARSFLRMPIEVNKKEIVRFVGGTKMKGLIMDGKIKEAFTLLGIFGEKIVQEGFETRGFGRWVPNAQRTIDEKGSDSPLIDEGQLRRAVSSDVVAKS